MKRNEMILKTNTKNQSNNRMAYAMQHTQDKCQHTINSCMDRLKNHAVRAVRTANIKIQIHAHLRDIRNVHVTVCMYVSGLTSMSTFLRVIDAIKN